MKVLTNGWLVRFRLDSRDRVHEVRLYQAMVRDFRRFGSLLQSVTSLHFKSLASCVIVQVKTIRRTLSISLFSGRFSDIATKTRTRWGAVSGVKMRCLKWTTMSLVLVYYFPLLVKGKQRLSECEQHRRHMVAKIYQQYWYEILGPEFQSAFGGR